MDTLVDIAKDSSLQNIFIIFFVIALFIILLMCSVVWWLIKDRMNIKTRFENLLESRLSLVEKTMLGVEREVRNIISSFSKQVNNFVSKNEFEFYIKEHGQVHNHYDDRLYSIIQCYDSLHTEMREVNEKLDKMNEGSGGVEMGIIS